MNNLIDHGCGHWVPSDLKPFSGPRVFGCARWSKDFVKKKRRSWYFLFGLKYLVVFVRWKRNAIHSSAPSKIKSIKSF